MAGLLGTCKLEYELPSLMARTAAAKSLMMRYQHCAWSEAGQGIPSADLLTASSMTSASDGWALGVTNFPTGQMSRRRTCSCSCCITPRVWQRVNLDERQGFQGGILRMFSKDDGWLMSRCMAVRRSSPRLPLSGEPVDAGRAASAVHRGEHQRDVIPCGLMKSGCRRAGPHIGQDLHRALLRRPVAGVGHLDGWWPQSCRVR